MKKAILVSGMLCSLLSVNAQTTQSIAFDSYVSTSNNDLKNKFIGSYTFSQVASGGITGGAVAITGNNDRNEYNLTGWATLKDTFNITANNLNASICFKYAPNTNTNYQPAAIKIQTVGVDLSSMSDCLNAYYEYNGNEDGQVSVNTIASSSSSSFHTNLVTGHWYKLSISTQKGAAPTVNFTISLQDLGATGTGTPQTIATKTSALNIGDFFNPDYDIMVGFTGDHAGGADYLDNFSVTGTMLHGSSNINEAMLSNAINMPTLVNDQIPITISELNEIVNYTISDINGKTLFTGKFTNKTNINIAGLTTGSYFASFRNKDSKIVKKFLKQ
jgi:hypothetical protein